MLLLGHAAVSARRGPRGTCQETRAALWAPAECGVTARSASDGVDVNGIRVHHRRLQYRQYQCGRSNGYFEKRLKPWDYAAAALILEEAGGLSSEWNGQPLQYKFACSFICGSQTAFEYLKGVVS